MLRPTMSRYIVLKCWDRLLGTFTALVFSRSEFFDFVQTASINCRGEELLLTFFTASPIESAVV